MSKTNEKGFSHDWTGPDRVNRHVHCARCGKIFEILKDKGECMPIHFDKQREGFVAAIDAARGKND